MVGSKAPLWISWCGVRLVGPSQGHGHGPTFGSHLLALRVQLRGSSLFVISGHAPHEADDVNAKDMVASFQCCYVQEFKVGSSHHSG